MKINLNLILIVLFTYNTLFSKTKEVVPYRTISFVVQSDSLFLAEYDKVKKYFKAGNYTEALKDAQTLLQKKDRRREEIILLNYLIGDVFYTTSSHINAIKYFRKTLRYLENKDSIKDAKNLFFNEELIKAKTLLKYGNTFYKLNEIEPLKVYKDSAIYFYNEVDNIFSLNKDVLAIKSRAYTNFSSIYLNDSSYKKAKDYAKRAIDIHRSQNNKINEAATLANLASVYLVQNDFYKAKNTYYEAIHLIRNIRTGKALKIKETLYYNLAYNLYKLKDYKAYDYQELSYNIKDSLRDKEIRKTIEELEAKYNFDSAKKLLLKEQENKRLKDQRAFGIVGIGLIVVILSLLFSVGFYKLKQKNLKLELSKNQLIQEQNIEKIKSESQVRILNATIDGKESERKQIAETLHDSVSALLSSANLHLQATRSQFKNKSPVEIDKTQRIITEASQKIRDLSHTLVSSVLLKFGLEYAVKEMAEKYSNSKIKFETKIGETRRYHQKFEIKVYNIIQEFLNNILKHSKAEKSMLELGEVNGKLYLKITDDGIGFDKTTITAKNGLGINQIDARIQMMKGSFYIDSSKGNGTVIKITLPILERETNLA